MYDSRLPTRVQIGAGATQSLTAVAVAAYSHEYMENSRVWRLMCYVTTAVVSTVAVSVQFLYRPTFGSATGQTILGTVNIPAGALVDSVYYKDITPQNLNAGGQLAFNVSVAAAGGGAAGAAFHEVIADLDPETALNQSKFIAST